MVAAALLGGGIGVGLLLVVRGLWPKPPPLKVVLDRLDQPAGPPATAGQLGAGTDQDSWQDQLGQLALKVADSAGVGLAVDPRDLHLVGRTRHQQAARQAGLAATGLAVPWLLAVVSAAAGGPAPPVAATLLAGVAGGGLGWWLPARRAAEAAQARRQAFRHALSSYLDLVNVLLAGGVQINSALHRAAEAGGGWAFATLRRHLHRARLVGNTPWEAFRELADKLAVDELAELATAVSLVGDHGAQIRKSLASRGDTLRAHQLAAVESDAEAATQKMVIPTALLVVSYVLFVAYPAVWQLAASAGTTAVS